MLKKTLGLFLAFSFSSSVFASEIGTIWKNNRAVDLLKQEKKLDAFEEFSELIGQDPFQPLFQYNLGAGFLATDEIEKGRKMYKEVIKTKGLPKPVAFASYFNLGALAGAEGQIDEALRYYQKALAYEPDSKETKTNIELLIQQKKGGGKGKSDKNKKNQNQSQQNKDQQKEPQKFDNKPQQFDQKQMSTQDVKKILEELKKQEQRIRAKHQRKGKREKDRAKNW